MGRHAPFRSSSSADRLCYLNIIKPVVAGQRRPAGPLALSCTTLWRCWQWLTACQKSRGCSGSAAPHSPLLSCLQLCGPTTTRPPLLPLLAHCGCREPHSNALLLPAGPEAQWGAEPVWRTVPVPAGPTRCKEMQTVSELHHTLHPWRHHIVPWPPCGKLLDQPRPQLGTSCCAGETRRLLDSSASLHVHTHIAVCGAAARHRSHQATHWALHLPMQYQDSFFWRCLASEGAQPLQGKALYGRGCAHRGQEVVSCSTPCTWPPCSAAASSEL